MSIMLTLRYCSLSLGGYTVIKQLLIPVLSELIQISEEVTTLMTYGSLGGIQKLR